MPVAVRTASYGGCIALVRRESVTASRLPVAARKASLRWRGFITSVANRNLRAMSFYRKEEARNVARNFLPRPSHPPLLSPFASSSPTLPPCRRGSRPSLSTGPSFSFSSAAPSPLFLIPPSILAFFCPGVLCFRKKETGRPPLARRPPPPRRWTPPIEASLFADNLAERKSHRRARSSGEQNSFQRCRRFYRCLFVGQVESR